VAALTWLGAADAPADPAPKAEIVPTVPHAQMIRGLAFDADGSHLVSADADGLTKVWDTRARQLLRTFDKDLYGINAVAFSPDGKQVVTAGHDSWAMKLVDAATGARLRTFNGHETEILCAAFSPDGKRIASGSRDRHVMIWDAASGARVFDLDGHSQGVYALAFTPNGKQLLTASFDKSIRVWDAETGKPVRTLTGIPLLQYLKSLGGFGPELGEDVFQSIAVSLDGKWALSGSWGKVRNVKLWDLAAGKLVRVFEGQQQSVIGVGFTPDGSRVFAAGEYGKVVLWDTATGAMTRTMAPHGESFLLDVAVISPNGKDLAVGGGTGPELWDIETGDAFTGFGTGLRLGLDLAFTADGSRLAVTADNGVAVWDVVGGRLIRNIGEHANEAAALAISRDGSVVLTGGRDNLVKLWDVATGGLLKTFAGHANWLEHVALSNDKRYAASGSSIDGIIKIWDVESGKQLQELNGHAASIAGLEFSADGLSLLSGSWDGSVSLWDLTQAAKRFDFKIDVRATYNPKSNPPEQSRRAIDWVGFSNDGARLMAVTHDGAASAWDAHTGAELVSRPSISTYINPVILSRDGSKIYWDADLGSVQVSDVATGKEIGTLPGAAKPGSLAMTTSADGRLLASVGNDRIVRIWDTGSGKLLASLFNGGNESWAALTPQGFFSASSSKAGALLSIVRGLESISIGQTWQSLYAPDLVREALAGDPDGELGRASQVTNLDKVVDSGPAPLVEFTFPPPGDKSATELVSVAARIKDQGKGIGRIEWRLNGIVSAVTDAPAGQAEVMAAQTLALDAGENVIEVVAYNARNILASLPAQTTITYTGETDAVKPKLHVLAIGINAYHDDGWKPPGSDTVEYFPALTLAAGDAASFAAEMKKASEGLYGEVQVTTSLDAEATPAGIERIVERISAAVNPRDTFVLYAAAHGYSVGGRFYLIPQNYNGGTDPQALATRAVGQERLQDWIANKIHAKKVLILLDTCESGALTNGYEHSRTDGPASEAALGRLHEATGRPVLTAAAAGKPAFEGYRGHGVFTWALIDALYHADANADGLIALSELAAHVQDTVPRISAELSGTGRAAIAVRGSTDDDKQSAHFGAIGGDFALVRRLQ
jgi:WD40 repeat protein